MPSLWIIDGFNLIRQSRDLTEIEAKSLEKAKALLLGRLKNLSERSGERIICVFDATGSVNERRVDEPHGPVHYLYTKAFETADEAIIEMCREMKQGAIVVSSDREIRDAAERAGSAVISSPDFDHLLRRLESPRSFVSEEEQEQGYDPKKGTKKKGPAHRRSKKERKVFGKIKRML